MAVRIDSVVLVNFTKRIVLPPQAIIGLRCWIVILCVRRRVECGKYMPIDCVGARFDGCLRHGCAAQQIDQS